MSRWLLLPGLLAAALAAPAAQGPATLIVLNKTDATLVKVDPASGKILGTVPTGEGPHEVTVSADGRTAFVGNYGAQGPGGNTISVIDLNAMKELKRVDVIRCAARTGCSSRTAGLLHLGDQRVVARSIPPTRPTAAGTGQAGTRMVWVTRDATRMYTCNIGSNSISILERGPNPNAAWNVTSIPVGRGPEGFDVSPDGRELWAAHSQDGGVSFIDIEQKKVTGTLELQTKRSNRLKFTPDGKLVLISDLDAGECWSWTCPRAR
jgi:DNA-binding beta-propeller fold protein YncE